MRNEGGELTKRLLNRLEAILSRNPGADDGGTRVSDSVTADFAVANQEPGPAIRWENTAIEALGCTGPAFSASRDTARAPLRERKQDIPLLAGHILERVARTTGVQRNISDDALKLMLNYDWPGNVRELENCLERACALTSGPPVHIGDLPTTLQNFNAQEPVVAVNLESSGISPLAELEKRAILQAITTLNGDKLEAAKQLGIGKPTLYRKLKEYGSTI